MSKLDKLIELGGNMFDNVGEFRKTIEEIWKDEEIEIGHILSIEGGFVGLSIDTEEGEYIARYKEVEDEKIMFITLEEVE